MSAVYGAPIPRGDDGLIPNSFLPTNLAGLLAIHQLGGVQTNATSTSVVDLYTCSNYARITGVIITAVSMSGTVLSAGTISLGKTGGTYVDVIPATVLSSLTAQLKQVYIPFTVGNCLVDGDVLKLNISSAFTFVSGGAITIEVIPIGLGN